MITSLMFALALQSAEAAPSAAPESEDIVVIARRLRDVTIDFRVTNRRGHTRLSYCRVTRGSGDRSIDAIGCQAVRSCVAAAPPSREAFMTCIDQQREAFAERLAAERRG